MHSFWTDPFGFKRRRADRELAERLQLEEKKRRALADKHEQAFHGASRIPFGKRRDVQEVVRAKDADTVNRASDPADPNNALGLLNPASPLYAGNQGHGYSGGGHTGGTHARDCDAGSTHSGSSYSSHGHGSSHDHGASYGGGGYDGGSCGGSDGGGGGGGGD